MSLRKEESELDRGNGELGKGGNGETVEGVSWKLKFESLGEMCEVSCEHVSVGLEWGGEVERRRKLRLKGVGIGVRTQLSERR